MIKYTRATTRKSIYSTLLVPAASQVHDYPGLDT